MKLIENPEIGELYEITYDSFKDTGLYNPVKISIWANIIDIITYDTNNIEYSHVAMKFNIISVSDKIRFGNSETVMIYNNYDTYKTINLEIKKIS